MEQLRSVYQNNRAAKDLALLDDKQRFNQFWRHDLIPSILNPTPGSYDWTFRDARVLLAYFMGLAREGTRSSGVGPMNYRVKVDGSVDFMCWQAFPAPQTLKLQGSQDLELTLFMITRPASASPSIFYRLFDKDKVDSSALPHRLARALPPNTNYPNPRTSYKPVTSTRMAWQILLISSPVQKHLLL